MPARCTVPMRRSRVPSRTGSAPTACDVSGVLGPYRGVGVRVSHRAGVSWGADTMPFPTVVSQLGSVCWQVRSTLSSSELQEVSEPTVHLPFNVWDRERGTMAAVPAMLSANKFRVLLAGEAPAGMAVGGFCRRRCCGRHAGKGMLEEVQQ